MADKNLVFTWQPSCIVVKGPGLIDGKPNTGLLTHNKINKCWEYNVTAELGFRLVHNRAWEILEIQAIDGTLSVNTFPAGSLALADMQEILSVVAGTRDIERRQFGACETVAFKTTAISTSTEFRIYVREYFSNAKGN